MYLNTYRSHRDPFFSLFSQELENLISPFSLFKGEKKVSESFDSIRKVLSGKGIAFAFQYSLEELKNI